MRPKRRRFLKAALITIGSAALLIAISGPVISRLIDDKVKERFEAEDARIGSLHINLFTRSVSIDDFEWAKGSKSATVKSIYVGGIRILPLLLNKKISGAHVYFEDGKISIGQDKDSVQQTRKQQTFNIKSIDIDRITIKDIDVEIKKDSVVEYQGNVNLSLHFVALDSVNNFRDPSAYTFRNVETTVRDLRIHKAGSLVEFKLKEGRFDKELKTLHLDSVSLEPLVAKADWGKRVKSQDTRTSLRIASVDASGVNMTIHMDDTAVIVKSLTINTPVLHAYKNKKYPFTRTERFPLPMESFASLNLGIEIDSIKIHNGDITYEELPVDGFHYAHITFADVEASMSSVNNREYKNMRDHATLEASAHVMKTGEVKATFKLPLDSKKKYGAEGSISNVPLKELNPLLKDLAFVEIESGKLTMMDFIFAYDDNGSVGKVRFDYEDLRILGLNKDKDMEVNQFKTLLINTAVKNDQTLNGDIDVARNKRKAVFNLWAQSLADGIKSGLIPVRTSKKKDKKGK